MCMHHVCGRMLPQVYASDRDVFGVEVWTDHGRSWLLGKRVSRTAYNATPCIPNTPVRLAYFFGRSTFGYTGQTRMLGLVWEPYTPIYAPPPPPRPPPSPEPPSPPPPGPNPPPFPPL